MELCDNVKTGIVNIFEDKFSCVENLQHMYDLYVYNPRQSTRSVMQTSQFDTKIPNYVLGYDED